jgi:hypothetical protein
MHEKKILLGFLLKQYLNRLIMFKTKLIYFGTLFTFPYLNSFFVKNSHESKNN